jgi:hypothetical protein
MGIVWRIHFGSVVSVVAIGFRTKSHMVQRNGRKSGARMKDFMWRA